MKLKVPVRTFVVSSLLTLPGWPAQRHEIDSERSTLTVYVYRSGLFSACAHDHVITAPIAEGWVEFSALQSAQLRVDARMLRVLDPDL